MYPATPIGNKYATRNLQQSLPPMRFSKTLFPRKISLFADKPESFRCDYGFYLHCRFVQPHFELKNIINVFLFFKLEELKPQHNIVCKFQGPSIKAVTAHAFVPSRLESKQCKYSFLVVCFLIFPFYCQALQGSL